MQRLIWTSCAARTVDIRVGFSRDDALEMLAGLNLQVPAGAAAEVLANLYHAYACNDAELLEINPLAVVEGVGLVALDCKFVLDDSAIQRQGALSSHGSPDELTELEARGQELDLRYIELDGDIGLLANGAGLTMTTMDVIAHHGGAPANFLEIGGAAIPRRSRRWSWCWIIRM